MLKRVCSQCSFMCLSDFEFQFAHHMKKHSKKHEDLAAKDSTANVEKRACIFGDFETHSQVALHRHVQTGHKPNKKANEDEEIAKCFKCSHCEFTTHSKLLQLKHHDGVHGTMKLDKTCPWCRATGSKLWFKCSHCDFTTRFRRSLVKHSLGKHLYTWKKCSECSYRTKNSETLKKHRTAKHGDVKNWICCEKCSYRTLDDANLEKHRKRRHGDGGEKPVFACDKCSYKAKQKFNLIRHIKVVHAERVEKWYECGECSYRAKLECRLAEHVKTHGESKDSQAKFKCDKCSYQTDKNSTFKTHRLQHLGASQIEWFSCAKCSYRSMQKSNLKTHISKHHLI